MSGLLKDLVYLEHILECVDSIESYTSADTNTLALLKADRQVYDAVLYRLQTMAESVRNLDTLTRSEISTTLPWQNIIDFRSILVHNYLGIEIEIIVGVIERDLPYLKDAIQDYLEKKENE